MQIVITMAGEGSRFRDAGYTVPKYMVQVKGKTLFEWSLDSLTAFSAKITFVVRNGKNLQELINFISEKCKARKIDFAIDVVNELTKGQAETAYIATSKLPENETLLIYNIDTYVEPFSMKPEYIYGEGFIPCFKGEGDHWSFVKLAPKKGKSLFLGPAEEVREKVRISDYCSIGAYYFRSIKLYNDTYRKYYEDGDGDFENKERYIAPMYNQMIKENLGVYIQDIPVEKVHVLGTPAEVKIFEEL